MMEKHMDPRTASPQPRPQPHPQPHRARRLGRAAALLLAGAVLGAGGASFAQGHGPGYGPGGGPGWHHGAMEGRGGPHFHRGMGRGMEGEMMFGGRMMGPGSVERMVERIGRVVDASSEQKQKLRAIGQAALDDLNALRARRQDIRRQAAAALAAPTVDRARLESLRQEGMKLADEASRRLVSVLADAAEVLTPAQRAHLAQHMARRFDRRGG
jgi:Spy/CpxP family protein refolding chaperone